MSDVVKTYQATKDPKISLSGSAKAHLEKYMQKQPACKGVLISLDTTGCSGLAYVIEMLTEVPKNSWHNQVNGIDIYVPEKHVNKLIGTQLDYIKQGLNEKFVFNNPNETARCGCGESFTTDE